MPRRDDDNIQELEFEPEPATTPTAWEDEDEVPPGADDPDELDDEPADDPDDGMPALEPAPEPQLEAEPEPEPDVDEHKQAVPSPRSARSSSPLPRRRRTREPSIDDIEDPPERPVHPAARWVPWEDLRLEHKHWTNPRSVTGLGKESLAALAASIQRGTETDETGIYAGIADPLKVVKISTINGEFINLIIDGQRRYLATSVSGLPPETMIPVSDLEPDPVKWTAELAAQYLAMALGTVGTREGLSSCELSESAERLRAITDPGTGRDYTLAAIAETVGRSESWVSKILAARERASPALLLSWQQGQVTDEQFKDLAALDRRGQKKAVVDVVEARESGDKNAARTLVKERKAIATSKAKESKAEPETGGRKAKVKKGEQANMDLSPPKKAPPFAVVEDMLATAEATPPTHDYVKGMMDALRWDRGLMDAADFAKPWRHYMDHVANSQAKATKKKTKGG